eukprot:COSAG04_NODE_2261_length_4426_cov_1.913335_4_plen_75_part_00
MCDQPVRPETGAATHSFSDEDSAKAARIVSSVSSSVLASGGMLSDSISGRNVPSAVDAWGRWPASFLVLALNPH